MAFPAGQMLISADDHLDIHAMPPDTWSSALPKEWRERGPHVEETPDGPWWVCDGQRVSPSGRKETGFIAAHDHGFRPGQPQTRLEDMGAMRLVQYTRSGGGKRTPKEQQLEKVTILDIFQNVASVKAEMSGWIDYMHIGKADGRWVIVNVLWERRASPQ